MIRIILTLWLILSITMIYAQDSTTTKGFRFLNRKWKKSSFGILYGFYSEKVNPNQHATYNSENLVRNQKDIIPYDNTNFYQISTNEIGGSFINPYLIFHPFSKKKNKFDNRQELRIGISYYGNTGLKLDYNNSYTFFKGTDTTIVSSVEFKNNRSDIGLNIGYTLTSRPILKRLSLYAGADIAITYSVIHKVFQYVISAHHDTIKPPPSPYIYSGHVTTQTESDILKCLPSLSVRSNALFGLNVLVSEPVTLFLETRLGNTYFQSIGGRACLNKLTSVYFGLKFKI